MLVPKPVLSIAKSDSTLLKGIPLDISDEMEINKENKGDFRVNFEFVKPAPDSKEEKKVTIKLIKV